MFNQKFRFMKKVLLIMIAVVFAAGVIAQDTPYFMGIFAENENITEHLTYRSGGDTTFSVWNGWQPMIMGLLSEPFYGDTCLSLLGADTWLCFGGTSQNPLDFGDYYENGVLHLALKVPEEEDDTFRISIKTQDPQNEYTVFFYGSGQDPYGFERNNEWHELKIPFKDMVNRTGDSGWEPDNQSEISEAELSKIRNPFYICAKTNINISLDEIWYAKGLQDPGSVNVESNEIMGFKVYPNPANSVLYLDGISGQSSIEIFDMTGRKVLSLKNNANSVNIENLDPGVYLIKADDSDSSYTTRFIKK
jgi:hypothetical protein